MSLYLTSATSDAGAPNKALAASDATGAASATIDTYGGYIPLGIRVTLYTRSSAGALTQVGQGSISLPGDLPPAVYSVSVTVATEADIPPGGRTAVRVEGAASSDWDYAYLNELWLSPVESGHVIAAGTHVFQIKCETYGDGRVHWGAGQSYGPDGIFTLPLTPDAPEPPSSVTAAYNPDTGDIDVTLTDESSIEDGIRYKVAYDGGAYGEPVTIPVPDTTSFSLTPPEGWQSALVAVCAYNASGESAWVESNVLTLIEEHDGSADYGLALGFTADGLKTGADAADFGIALTFTATGHKSSGGAAAFSVALGADADGGGKAASGAADFTLALGADASGRKAASGTAAFGLALGLAASGAMDEPEAHEGDAALGLALAFTASGYKGASGAAAYDFDVALDTAGYRAIHRRLTATAKTRTPIVGRTVRRIVAERKP